MIGVSGTITHDLIILDHAKAPELQPERRWYVTQAITQWYYQFLLAFTSHKILVRWFGAPSVWVVLTRIKTITHKSILLLFLFVVG